MPKNRTATFPCNLDQVRDATLWMEQSARAFGMSQLVAMRLAVAFEELFANSIHHAELGPEGQIEVRLQRDGDGPLRVEYADHGVYFDPVADSKRVTGDPIAGAVGGVGVRLVLNLATEMHYRRDGDRNCITMLFEDAPAA